MQRNSWRIAVAWLVAGMMWAQVAQAQGGPEAGPYRFFLPLLQRSSIPWTASNQFGYEGRDNHSAGTPVFEWIEIQGTGTEITNSDWHSAWDGMGRWVGPFSLGFYFPYYDSQFNGLYVYDSGMVRFEFDSFAINALYKLTMSGHIDPSVTHIYIEHQLSPDRFVVEYRNLGMFDSVATADFEIVLYPSGQVVLQYLRVDDQDPTRFVVGLGGYLGADPLVYPRQPQAGRVVQFTYPSQPNHTYPPDDERWFIQTLTAMAYTTELDTILLDASESVPQTLFVGGAYGGLMRSYDSGRTLSFVTPRYAGESDASGTRSDALAPDYGKTGVVFAAGEAGLYRSANRGNSWARLVGPGMGLNSVVVSPTYVMDRTLAVSARSGVWMSTDAGLTWENRFPAVGADFVVGVRFSPDYSHDRTLWAYTWKGMSFRSVDGGESWQALALPGSVSDLQPAPDYAVSHSIYFVAKNEFKVYGLYHGGDGGDDWQSLSALGWSFRALVMSPNFATDRTMYAVGTNLASLARSSDGGRNWQPFDQGVTPNTLALAFAIHPATGRMFGLWIANGNKNTQMFSREAAGSAWSLETDWSPNLMTMQAGVSVDKQGVVTIIASHYRTETEGRTWQDISSLIQGHSFVAASLSPAFSADGIGLGLDGGRIWRTTDGGQSWKPQTMGTTEPHSGQQFLSLSPGFATDRTAFAASAGGVLRTTDAGASWQTVLSGGAPTVTTTPDYGKDQTVFTVSTSVFPNKLRRSTDGGITWTDLPLQRDVNMVVVSPTYGLDHTVYQAGNMSTGGGLWRSTDTGMTWMQVLAAPGGAAEALVLHPAYCSNPSMLYGAHLPPSIWQSSDGGATWWPGDAGKLDGSFYSSTFYVAAVDRMYQANSWGLWWRKMGWTTVPGDPDCLLHPTP